MARVSLALLAALLALGPAGAAPARAEDDLEKRAKALVEQLSRGDWEAAAAPFDAKMKEVLPPEKLEAMWGQLVSQCGRLGAIGEPRPEKVAGAEARFVRCDFARMALDAKVIFDGEGKIAGLFFAPAAELDRGAPTYADRAKFEETEAKVGAAGFPLGATLAIPREGDGANGLPAVRGPFPAVVLVHGSGPHDRDERGQTSARIAALTAAVE